MIALIGITVLILALFARQLDLRSAARALSTISPYAIVAAVVAGLAVSLAAATRLVLVVAESAAVAAFEAPLPTSGWGDVAITSGPLEKRRPRRAPMARGRTKTPVLPCGAIPSSFEYFLPSCHSKNKVLLFSGLAVTSCW
jgi:hypothetical protein